MDILDEMSQLADISAINNESLATSECWFCKKASATKETALEIDLHKHAGTKTSLSGTTHKWQEAGRMIPCCGVCREAHDRAKLTARRYAWVIGAIAVVVTCILPFKLLDYFARPYYELGEQGQGYLLAAGLAVSVVLAVKAFRYGKIRVYKSYAGTKPFDYAKEHPAVAPFISEGWKLGKHDYANKANRAS
jgi:hypothetical protein